MFYSQILLLGILTTIFLAIKYHLENKLFFLYFLLLLITPWFWTLLVGEPPYSHLLDIKGEGSLILNNLELVLSYKHLLFEGDHRLFYIVGQHGYFLLSFLPLLTTGIWTSLISDKLIYRKLVFILPMCFIASALLVHFIGFLSVYLFLPLLSLFATIGLVKYIEIVKTSKNKLIRILILANFLLIFYESIRLFRIMQVQFGFLNQ